MYVTEYEHLISSRSKDMSKKLEFLYILLEPAPQGMGAPFRGRYGNDTEMEFVRAVPVPKIEQIALHPMIVPGMVPGQGVEINRTYLTLTTIQSRYNNG